MKNDLHGDGASLTKLLNPDYGAVTGIAEKVNAYFLQSLKAQQKALEKDGKAEFSKTHLLTPSSRLLSTARILPTTRRWYGQPGAMPTRTCRKKSS